MSEEKTEKPTAKKRKENRKEGQVPRTQELGGWASLLLVGMALPALLGRELDRAAGADGRAQPDAGRGPDARGGARPARRGRLARAWSRWCCSAPCVMVVGVAAALAQGGFHLATKASSRSSSKLNPLKGAKRIFGPQALWEGAKMLLKSAVVGLLVCTRDPGADAARRRPGADPGRARAASPTAPLGLIRNVAVAGLVHGRRRLRHAAPPGRQADPDDQGRGQAGAQAAPRATRCVKGAIRARQLAAARNRMMADVPDRRRRPGQPDPRRRRAAVRRREAARPGSSPGAPARSPPRSASGPPRQRVPMVRDVPLARALYAAHRGRPGDPGRALRRRRPGARVRDQPAQPRASTAASTAAPRHRGRPARRTGRRTSSPRYPSAAGLRRPIGTSRRQDGVDAAPGTAHATRDPERLVRGPRSA